MIKVYGIKNCGSVSKALIALENEKIAYEFLDLKKGVLDENLVESWLEKGGDSIINKAGQTYKKLGLKGEEISLEKWKEIVLKNPTILKRPIIVGMSKKSPLLFGLKELEKNIGH